MKGAVRVAVLMFTALGLQRWLLWIGLALVIAGYLLPRPVSYVLVILGTALPLVPSIFAWGVMLRYFVAPRTTRLIPHAREQVLAGMALVTLAVATIATLMAWSLGFDAARVPLMWLRIAAGMSVIMLTQFAVITSPAGMTLWFVMLIGVTQSLITARGRELSAWIGQSTELLVAIIVVSWGAFSVWFLRTPSFKSPSDTNLHGRRVVKVNATYEDALRAFLFGNPSLRYQFMGGFMAVAFVVICWGFLFTLVDPAPSFADAVAKAIGPGLGIAAYAGLSGVLVVRRSRSLWLRGGLDRLGLFRVCEKLAWKSFGATLSSVLVLLALAWGVKPSIGVSYTVWLVFHLCAGACFLYWGLMHVRGWPVFDIVCALALICAWVMTFATAQLALSKPWLTPVLIAAMLGAALALRLVALHRWRQIDWLVCKPPRQPARDEMRMA